MRFKKLRIFVGVAIVIFILTLSSIAVIGLSSVKSNSKKINSKINLPVAVIEKQNSLAQQNNIAKADKNTKNTENKDSGFVRTPHSNPVIIHRRRSRAS